MNKIQKLYGSFIYLVAIGGLSLISWRFNLKEWGIITIFTLGVISLYFIDDLRVLLTSIIIGVMSIKSQTAGNRTLVVLTIAAALVFFVISLYFFIKRTKILGSGFKFGALMPGITIAVTAALLGGLLSPNFNFIINLKLLIKVSAVVLLYLMVINFINQNSREYILKALIVCGFIIMFEVVITYLSSGNFWKEAYNKSAFLGWGNHNSIALLLTVTIPMCAFLALSNPRMHAVYIFVIFIFALSIVFLFSRSNMLSLLVIMPLLLTYLIKKIERPYLKSALITALSCAIVFLILAMLILTKIDDKIFSEIISRGDSNRLTLYKEAWSIFKSHPFFGVGIYISNGIESLADWGTGVYTFHSAPMTILACFGILGIVGFIPFYFLRYKTILSSRFTPFGFFVILSVLVFEFYSFIDVGFIHFFLNVYIFTLIGLTEKKENPQGKLF